MAKRGVKSHRTNQALVLEERARIDKQRLMGKYMAWLNVQLRKNDMHLLWQAAITTDIGPPEVQPKAEGEQVGRATEGLSRDLMANGTEDSPEESVEEGTKTDESQQVEEETQFPITQKGLSQDLAVVESEEALRRQADGRHGRGAPVNEGEVEIAEKT